MADGTQTIIGDEQGKVKGIECIKMELGEPEKMDAGDQFRLKDRNLLLKLMLVIKAIGQSRYVDLIEEFDLDHDGGVVKINPNTFQTSNQKFCLWGCYFWKRTGRSNGRFRCAARKR